MYQLLLVTVLAVSGLSEAGNFNARIIDGENATIDEFPFLLELRGNNEHRCGASIIGDIWAVTAAHCLYKISASDITLHAGTSTLDDLGTVYEVEEAIQHEEFDLATMDYDIMLLKVKTPFVFGPKVQKVSLVGPNKVFAGGKMTTLVGWGKTDVSGEYSNLLQKLEVPLVNRVLCQIAHRNFIITDRMICAGFDDGMKDSCQGDSGGPMLYEGEVIGLVSWGIFCACPNSPAMYTNVSNLRNWVTQKTGI